MDAKVVIQALPAEDDNALVVDEEGASLEYSDFEVESHFRENDHKLRLPVASDKATVSSVFITTALPEIQLVVDWMVGKTGGKPKLPSPYLNDTNWVYQDGTITLEDVKPDSDGTAGKVIVKGQYIYGAKKRNGAVIRPAVPPWADPQIGKDLSFVDSDFVHGILDQFIDGTGQPSAQFGQIKS